MCRLEKCGDSPKDPQPSILVFCGQEAKIKGNTKYEVFLALFSASRFPYYSIYTSLLVWFTDFFVIVSLFSIFCRDSALLVSYSYYKDKKYQYLCCFFCETCCHCYIRPAEPQYRHLFLNFFTCRNNINSPICCSTGWD